MAQCIHAAPFASLGTSCLPLLRPPVHPRRTCCSVPLHPRCLCCIPPCSPTVIALSLPPPVHFLTLVHLCCTPHHASPTSSAFPLLCTCRRFLLHPPVQPCCLCWVLQCDAAQSAPSCPSSFPGLLNPSLCPLCPTASPGHPSQLCCCHRVSLLRPHCPLGILWCIPTFPSASSQSTSPIPSKPFLPPCHCPGDHLVPPYVPSFSSACHNPLPDQPPPTHPCSIPHTVPSMLQIPLSCIPVPG